MMRLGNQPIFVLPLLTLLLGVFSHTPALAQRVAAPVIAAPIVTVQEVAAKQSLDLDHLNYIDPLVYEAIKRGDLPGCVIAIGRRDGVSYMKAFGHRSLKPSASLMTTDTVFDLASLTKPVATATCAMQMIEQGRLRLQDNVADLIPRFGANGKEEIVVEQLFLHTAGFIPDNPISDYQQGVTEAWKRINALSPQSSPGVRFKYSDISFLVLGRILETLDGAPLDRIVQTRLFAPLGMSETGYNPDPELRLRFAPTEKIDGQWLRGRVHDPRAALLGGVAGHAGLFSTAGDLSRYARMMLSGGELEEVRVLSQATVREMTRPRVVGESQRALGWDILSGYSSNRGELMSASAFGHGGFTGTGIWIDPKLDLFVIFLSNRLHPDGEGSVNDLIGRIGAIAAASIQDTIPTH